MTIDWGVVFGLTGLAVGSLSLVYARTQSIHAKRQADAAHLATTLQVQREMSERVYKARMDLMQNPAIAKLYYEAMPDLAATITEQGGLGSVMTIRNAIDGLQDMYFLRKRSIVETYHWRLWTTAFSVVARVPLTRAVYDNAVAREAFDPEFAEFLRPIFDGKPLADPKPANWRR